MAGAKRGRRPDLERRRLALELRARGLTLAEIGRRFGVTREAVRQMLAACGQRGRVPKGLRRPPSEAETDGETDPLLPPICGSSVSFKISRAAQYALAALVHLAGQPPGRPIQSRVTAEAQGVPAPFLPKLLKHLVAAGILRSVRGPNGGYCLAKKPKDISLLEVIEAVGGFLPGEGDTGPENATGLDARLQEVGDEVAGTIRRFFQKARLSHLMDNGLVG